MVQFQTLLRNLEYWGLMEFILPVLLIFTATFAILQKLQIFTIGKDKPNKNVNLILALGIAFVAVIPHFTGQGPDVVLMISQLLPNSFVVLLALLLSLTLMSLVTSHRKPTENVLAGMLAFVAFGALLVIILQAGGIVVFPFLQFLMEPNTLALIIVILIFALVIWYVAGKTPTDDELEKLKKDPWKAVRDFLGGAFGG